MSLFPQPSKFELPKDFRNKFLYMSELNDWKRHHDQVKLFVCCLSLMIFYFLFFNMCRRKLCQMVNKLLYF